MNAEPTRPPCPTCGDPDAIWRGPEDGLRYYACDRCARRREQAHNVTNLRRDFPALTRSPR